MKRLTVWLLTMIMNRASKDMENEENAILLKAYGVMIDSYRKSIMFLNAQIGSDKSNR